MATLIAQPYSVPEPPKKFGEDGGQFWKYYDDLADELDEDLVKSLKAQLDGILIFAGLFAGVNSAFLALTLPMLSADPTDDTNTLLLQLLKGGNSTIQTADDLPSASFSPSSSVYAVNVLFSMSLTFGLLSSFLAVLGQQWLVYYRKRSGGGPEHQRWEQHRRYLGAKRWRLELVLDDFLPAMLQMGLAIFCISFVLYLHILNSSIFYFIIAPMGGALAILLVGAFAAAWDQWCPFKSPLSHAVEYVLKLASTFLKITVVHLVSTAQLAAWKIKKMLRQHDALPRFISFNPRFNVAETRRKIEWRVEDWTGALAQRRRAEDPKALRLVALKRILLTSEDFKALDCAVANLRAIQADLGTTDETLGDDEFHDRILDLVNRTSPWRGGSENNSTLKDRAFLYIDVFLRHIFFGSSIFDSMESEYRAIYRLGDLSEGAVSRIWEMWIRIALCKYHIVSLAEAASSDKLVTILTVNAIHGLLLRREAYDEKYLKLGDQRTMNLLEQEPSQALIRLISSFLVIINNYRTGAPDSPDPSRLAGWMPQVFSALQDAYTKDNLSYTVSRLVRALETATPDSLAGAARLYVTLLQAACRLEPEDWKSFAAFEAYSDNFGKVLHAIEGAIRKGHESEDGLELEDGHDVRRKCVSIAVDVIYARKGRYFDMNKSLPSVIKVLEGLASYLEWIIASFPLEPGHKENRIVLKLVRPFLQLFRDLDEISQLTVWDTKERGEHAAAYESFRQAYDKFEAWVEEGGCLKTPGRVDRDPELCWCYLPQEEWEGRSWLRTEGRRKKWRINGL